MATHSSVLAWRIPWAEKPGRLQSMGSHRIGHDWSDLAAAAAKVMQYWTSQVVLVVIFSYLPWQDMQETQVQSLGGKIPWKRETATHSNILAWRIPWTEEPGGLQSMGSQRVGHNSPPPIHPYTYTHMQALTLLLVKSSFIHTQKSLQWTFFYKHIIDCSH